MQWNSFTKLKKEKLFFSLTVLTEILGRKSYNSRL